MKDIPIEIIIKILLQKYFLNNRCKRKALEQRLGSEVLHFRVRLSATAESN